MDDSLADKLLPGCTTLKQVTVSYLQIFLVMIIQLWNEIFHCKILQVKESLLQKCQEVEQTAREQATDNAILDQLRKVIILSSEK